MARPQALPTVAVAAVASSDQAAALKHAAAAAPTQEFAELNSKLKQILMDLDLSQFKTIAVPDPQDNILYVRKNDVLCGRGGETNHHSGNIMYRQFVRACQPDYMEAKRRDKPYIAQRIVLAVRRMGGRFLKKDRAANAWKDVGNTKAREKTSQALREGAPELRIDGPMIIPFGSKLVPSHIDTDALKRRLSFPCVLVQKMSAPSTTAPPRDTSSPPPSKKLRVSLSDLAEAAASSPRSSGALEASSQQTPACAAAISADDDESSQAGAAVPTANPIQGPRIKLLKKRQDCDDSV